MTYCYPAKISIKNGIYEIALVDFDLAYKAPNVKEAIREIKYMLWRNIEEIGEYNLPKSSDFFMLKEMNNKDECVVLIEIDVNEFRKRYDNRAVKKTLTIPKWLNDRAEEASINFSHVLQEALKAKLGIN